MRFTNPILWSHGIRIRQAKHPDATLVPYSLRFFAALRFGGGCSKWSSSDNFSTNIFSCLMGRFAVRYRTFFSGVAISAFGTERIALANFLKRSCSDSPDSGSGGNILGRDMATFAWIGRATVSMEKPGTWNQWLTGDGVIKYISALFRVLPIRIKR